MEWSNESFTAAFTPRWPAPELNSFNLLYNVNFDPYAGSSSTAVNTQTEHFFAGPATEKINNYCFPANNSNNEMMVMMKKKRLTSEQLASLERSFQEEIKLDSERKMKLSRELGLQPRQIAVWFQNRRARWKAKQLEQLYDSLRQEYDVVSREKIRLQEEVNKLRAILRGQEMRKKQTSADGTTEASGGEETLESTSSTPRITEKPKHSNNQIAGENNSLYSVNEYNNLTAVASPYWPLVLPSYP